MFCRVVTHSEDTHSPPQTFKVLNMRAPLVWIKTQVLTEPSSLLEAIMASIFHLTVSKKINVFICELSSCSLGKQIKDCFSFHKQLKISNIRGCFHVPPVKKQRITADATQQFYDFTAIVWMLLL